MLLDVGGNNWGMLRVLAGEGCCEIIFTISFLSLQAC